MILLASLSADTLDRWECGLQGLATRCRATDVESLRATLAHAQPDVLVLDLDMIGPDAPSAVATLRTLSAATDIVAMSGPASDELELDLFRVGVRGCCRSDIDPQMLKRAVLTVQLGELWIRRSLVPQLLDGIGAACDDVANVPRAMVGRLAQLTRREREIAALLAGGGSNKQIARLLAISERTVKAHLSAMFRKVGVSDRLKLALLLVGSDDVSPLAAQAGLAGDRPLTRH